MRYEDIQTIENQKYEEIYMAAIQEIFLPIRSYLKKTIEESYIDNQYIQGCTKINGEYATNDIIFISKKEHQVNNILKNSNFAIHQNEWKNEWKNEVDNIVLNYGDKYEYIEIDLGIVSDDDYGKIYKMENVCFFSSKIEPSTLPAVGIAFAKDKIDIYSYGYEVDVIFHYKKEKYYEAIERAKQLIKTLGKFL